MGYELVRVDDASPGRLGRLLRNLPKKKGTRRARVALRLRLDLVTALDKLVAKKKRINDRVSRTSVIEAAIKAYLKQKKALR
jgi:hypothetical protein